MSDGGKGGGGGGERERERETLAIGHIQSAFQVTGLMMWKQ